jgi:hypothetical protein
VKNPLVLFSGLLLAALVVVPGPGCSDRGEEPPVEPPTVLTAVPPSVTVGPGQSVNVLISGGTPPYAITVRPDTSLISALLQNPTSTPVTLVVTGVTVASAAGSTTVRVADSSPVEQGISIQITKTP